MKFTILALALALASTTATASDLSADLGLESKFIYRGVDLSPNADYSLNGSFRLADFQYSGVYLRGQMNSLDGVKGKYRGDAGVGFAKDLGTWNYDVSVNYMTDNAWYGRDVTEVRGVVGYDVNDSVNVYGLVAQQVGSGTDDTYGAIGVDYFDAFGVKNLKVGALTSAQNYNGYNDKFKDGGTQYNNSEITASYLVAPRVAMYGKYSFGGENRFGQDLDNVGSVGVRVLF